MQDFLFVVNDYASPTNLTPYVRVNVIANVAGGVLRGFDRYVRRGTAGWRRRELPQPGRQVCDGADSSCTYRSTEHEARARLSVANYTAALPIGHASRWQDRQVAKRESVGARLKRLRLERGLSQRQLSAPGVSYAYISRIEAGARVPSVKALRQLARKLGVTVEHLETGQPTPVEQGVLAAGLDYGSLTTRELRAIQDSAEHAARQGAQHAAEKVLDDRRKDEVPKLRKRLDELAD